MTLPLTGMAPLLQVFDMPTSIRFYRDLLGFEVVSNSPPLGGQDNFNWVLLRRDDVEMMLNTAYEADSRPPRPDAARIASHGDTCLYFGCPEVDAAYAALRARGLKVPEPKIAPYGMKQMAFQDPDGYSLCFQWRA